MKNKKTGHTPGDIIRAVITGTENEQINAAIMGASMELDWSDTPDNIREQAEAQAAQMFAAAPDLLAFAEATAQTFGPDTMISKEARAAIAKAKGES